jgi:hypothetical protein
MKDTIEIREQGGAGRMIHLAPELRKTEQPNDTEDGEVCDTIIHCQLIISFCSRNFIKK